MYKIINDVAESLQWEGPLQPTSAKLGPWSIIEARIALPRTSHGIAFLLGWDSTEIAKRLQKDIMVLHDFALLQVREPWFSLYSAPLALTARRVGF